jgi:hypothetical protein
MNAQIEPLLDDPIEIALAEQALSLAKSRAKWNSIRDFYRPIVNALHRLGLEPRLSSDVDLHFSGDAHKLASVVRILRTAGFSTTAARPKQGDTQWSAYYHHPDCGTSVWLYFTSSVCKRVKVGTKMVEQDVYEVQCGDITAADEPPALTIVPAPASLEADETPF